MWEDHLPLPPRPGRPARSLPLLDAQGPRKTVGTHLTEDEIVLYREWIENNRELERIVTEMRGLSSRVLAFIPAGRPHEPRVSGSSAAVTATAILQTLRPAH